MGHLKGTYCGTLINHCDPDVKDVKAVVVKTGEPPLPPEFWGVPEEKGMLLYTHLRLGNSWYGLTCSLIIARSGLR